MIFRILFFGPMLFLTLSCAQKGIERDYANQYSPFSQAVVKLTVTTDPQDTLYVEVTAITNIPRGRSESDEITITHAGEYYLQLAVDRINQSSIIINDSAFNIITAPHDTTLLYLEHSATGSFNLTFEGNYKAVNEYFFNKRNTLGYSDLRYPLNNWITSKSKYKQILDKTDSLAQVELDFLQSYVMHKTLPEWFIDYEQSEINYMAAGFKQTMVVYNKLFEVFKDSLPANYFDFLSGIIINNEKAILTSAYILFMDEYFMRDLSPDEYMELGGYERASKIYGHIHKNSQNQLSDKVSEVYHQYMFSSLSTLTSDSVKIDSMAHALDIKNSARYSHLFGQKDRDKKEFKNLQRGDEVIDFFVVDENDSLVSIRDFSDRIVYLNFWATWCGPCIKNIPELNQLIAEFANQDIVFLNICLNSEKDRWMKTLHKTKLKGVNVFAEGNWGKRLSEEFNIQSIPTYTLLEKGNRLYENHTHKAPQVRDKIIRLLVTSDE
jgi:thiol-disulfide isomerase/thioredoxin